MASVLCLGETLIDLIASDGATRLEEASAFVARTGGAPANAAVALARLGVSSAFCGMVGADPFGERLRKTLANYGVDVARLRSTAEAGTTIAFAWKDGRGDGHFQLVRLADRLLAPADVEEAGIETCAAIVAGSVALSAEPSRAAIARSVELANRARVPVCFDVNLRPSLWSSRAAALTACEPIFAGAALLKLSLDDGRALFAGAEEAMALLRAVERFPVRFVVITDGERGAWFTDRSKTGGDLVFVPSFKVEAVEPTGAGDAFSAALVARLIERAWDGLSVEDLRFAAAAGALATTKPGAMEALPSRVEIEAFLARQTS